MATAHNIQTKRDIVKPLQYVGEGDSITTPTLYGVTITSPTFVAAGHNSEINLQPDIAHMDTEVLGSEDIVNAVKTGELYAFQISYEPTDTVLMQYAWDASGGGVASIDESLTFTFTELLNGVENWTVMRGCRPTSMTATLERGIWLVTMTWIAQNITLPAAVDPFTTPTYATEPSAATVQHTDAGADPFTWNSVAVPESRFSITVTRALAIEAVNGELRIIFSKASDRKVECAVDVFVKDNVLETDYVGKTKRAANYSFSTSPNKDFVMTNCIITSYSRVKTATSTDAFRESIGFRAESVTDFV